MQTIKSSLMTPFSRIPQWLKWCMLICCLLIPIVFLIYPYARSAEEIKQSYQTALQSKNYKSAFQYLDHQYPGLSYTAFQHWQEQLSSQKQIVVHKVPIFFHALYIWRVDLPTKNVSLQVPFPNLTVRIDGLPYQITSTETAIPLIIGTHSFSVQLGDLKLDKQSITVTKDPEKQTIQLAVQPSSHFTEIVQNFIRQYNKTWCQAVDLRTPDSILPFLSGRTSSEYQYLAHYIQTVTKQTWIHDFETLKDLKITNIQFKDATHMNVTTNEVYHHDIQIVKNHDTYHQGEKKQYDTNISWIYTLKLIDSKTLQIESLSQPL